MRRIHLFEFHDLHGFPPLWRNFLSDVMVFFASTFDPYAAIVPKLKKALEQLDCHNLLDLCSGAAGPLVKIQRHLESKEGFPIKVFLTDRYPYVDAFRRASVASGGGITGIETPVHATEVPPHLKGFRTLFTSFHHFELETAKQILADAVRKGEGIGVFEYTERSFRWVVPMLLTPLFVWVITPFLRPFNWQRLLWTYLIPVVPLTAFWDGIVSGLRTYTPRELNELLSGISARQYTWDVGQVRYALFHHITYLIGYPTSRNGL